VDIIWRRFIPNREGQDLQASFSLLHEDGSPATPSKIKKRTPQGELHYQKSECRHPHYRVPFPSSLTDNMFNQQLRRPIAPSHPSYALSSLTRPSRR
jgi:cell division cycle 20-like protein 1, cofactor of APC complex